MAAILFIILIVPSLNNLPYGDDNVFVFDSYLQDVPSLLNFWDPYSNFFRSWPLPFSIFSALLKAFGKEVIIFRLLNTLLHVLNAFIFHTVLRHWKKSSSSNEKFLLFCLFLFHPMALTTVNWVFQLKTLLCMTFTLLTLLFFEKASEKSAIKNALLGLVFFALALSSKIACVLFPFYALTRWKKWEKKMIFVPTVLALFLLSGFAGLINLKGINSFFQEKTTSEKPVTDYGENFDKVAVAPSFRPSNYYHTDLSHQLLDSASQLSKQFQNLEDIKLKAIMSLFTFGRYINSSLGLNRYSLVYEPTWASLLPGVVESFIGVTFVFLIVFVSRENWKAFLLSLLFFIPISGVFYVPYMKYSYVADHWFYLSLPFLLSVFIMKKGQKFKTIISLIVFSQFIISCYDFRSTEAITTKSLNEYQNPFLYTYILDDLEKRGRYQEAYELVDDYIAAKGYIDEVAIKTRLRLNYEHLNNRHMPRDLDMFLKHTIGKADFPTAIAFIKKFSGVLPPQRENQYKILLAGLSKLQTPNAAKLLLEKSKQPQHK